MDERLFLKFNRTNLVNHISKSLHLEKSILRGEVKEYLWPRLDFLRGKRSASVYYLFEENYTESEWKDMISVHYINTSYKVDNSVMRVHVFMKPEFSSKNYLGFFTLRRVNEARIMLSFIYPNWANLVYMNEHLCVMTYKKTIHLMGESLSFHTYPLFVQDDITVACAHVSMISVASYLHEKFDYPKIRILNIYNSFSTGKTKIFPTSGLTPSQMIEIFDTHDIPIGHLPMLPYDEIEGGNTKVYEQCHRYIDYSVESGIPVILGMQIKDSKMKSQRHVVQIIGHAQQDRNSYVVYDDSGYFIRNVLKRDGFVSVVDWNLLKQYIKQGKSFLLYPIHEKVYLLYDSFREACYHLIENSPSLLNLGLKKSEKRFFLADNIRVKEFLKERVLPFLQSSEKIGVSNALQKKELEILLSKSMPHYIWICEFEIDGGYFLFLADSTLWRRTKNNLFYNSIPIFSKTQFGLLITDI